MAENAFHHGQVHAVRVRLEQMEAGIELKEDAADRPNVARLLPSQSKDDFRCPVKTHRYNFVVMMVVERRTAEIDEANVSPLDAAVIFPLQQKINNTLLLFKKGIKTSHCCLPLLNSERVRSSSRQTEHCPV